MYSTPRSGPMRRRSYAKHAMNAAAWAFRNRQQIRQTFNTWRSGLQNARNTLKRIRNFQGVGHVNKRRAITVKPEYSNRRIVKREIHGDSTGWSQSYKKLKYKAAKIAKIYKQLSNRSVYETVDPVIIATGQTGLTGGQQVKTIDTLYDSVAVQSAIQEMFLGLAAGHPLADADWLPNGTSPNAPFQRHQKFLLDGVQCEYEFVNQSEANTHLSLYFCMAKDTGSLSDPETDWQDGYNETAGAGVVSTSTQRGTDFPFQRPTTSKNFNMKWWVVNERHIFMSPGGQHTHKFSFSPKNIIDAAYFITNSKVRGITIRLMIVARGTPADTTTNYGETTQITTTPVKVIGTARHRYVTRMLISPPELTYQANNLTKILLQNSGAPTNAIYQQNEETGNPVNLADNDFVA